MWEADPKICVERKELKVAKILLKTGKPYITQMSINSVIHEQKTVYLYHEILYSNKNKFIEMYATLILENIRLQRKGQTWQAI